MRPFEPEDSGDTKTPSDKIPDQGCGHGLGGKVGHPGCGIPCSVAPIIIRRPHCCCQSTRPHLISRAANYGGMGGDGSRGGCTRAKASVTAGSVAQQKISITDSCLPFIFNYITLIVSLTVGIEDMEVGIQRSEQGILALKRPAA